METEEFVTDNQRKKNRYSENWSGGDIVFGILIIIYAILMFIGAMHFPHRAQMGIITSAKFTPMLLSILMIILCCTLIIVTIRKYGSVSIAGWFKEIVSDETMRRSFILIIMIGLYILLIGRIHFIIINILYFFVMYYYLKIGSWKMIILYSVASGLFVSVVVPNVFQMPLP
jgi:hypothetical protein